MVEVLVRDEVLGAPHTSLNAPIGATRRYTVGVWVGNFDGKPMWNVSGVSGAAPAWFEVVTRLHRGNLPAKGKRPDGVTVRRISFPDEAEPARDELFLAGTEPEKASAPRFAARPPRIVYPSEGMVVALDPDIPGALQRLFFESRGGAEGCSWDLDGEALGRADRPAPWSPSLARFPVLLLPKECIELE